MEEVIGGGPHRLFSQPISQVQQSTSLDEQQLVGALEGLGCLCEGLDSVDRPDSAIIVFPTAYAYSAS